MNQVANWKPSPGVWVFVGLLSVVVVLTGIFAGSENNTAAENEEELLAERGERPLFDQLDTDSDGLKNWEEALWTTNPENPDTDGDGTPDGAEVNAGRDPLTPGPDDKLHLVAVRDASATSTATDTPPTQTELFSQAFINSYLTTKLSGGSFTDQLDTLSELALPILSAPEQYTADDITTVSADEQTVHTYGNTLGDILNTNAPHTENEMILVLRAINEDDKTYLNNLSVITNAYRANASDMLEIAVPGSAAAHHLNTVNAFLFVARDIELMELLFDDALTALAGFENYQTSSESLIAALEDTSAYLLQHTSFTPSESGYLFISEL